MSLSDYFGAASFQSLAARGGPPGRVRCCRKPAVARKPIGPAAWQRTRLLANPAPLGMRSFAEDVSGVVAGFGGAMFGGHLGAGTDCSASGLLIKVVGNLSDVKSALVNAILDCGEQQVKDAVASMPQLQEYAGPFLDAAIAAAREKANKAAGTTAPPRAGGARPAWRDRLPADPCATIPADVRAQIPAISRASVVANRAVSCAATNPEEFKRKAAAAGGGGGGGSASTASGGAGKWTWIGLGAAALGIGGLIVMRRRRARAA